MKVSSIYIAIMVLVLYCSYSSSPPKISLLLNYGPIWALHLNIICLYCHLHFGSICFLLSSSLTFWCLSKHIAQTCVAYNFLSLLSLVFDLHCSHITTSLTTLISGHQLSTLRHAVVHCFFQQGEWWCHHVSRSRNCWAVSSAGVNHVKFTEHYWVSWGLPMCAEG